jgi:hypothetical protein
LWSPVSPATYSIAAFYAIVISLPLPIRIRAVNRKTRYHSRQVDTGSPMDVGKVTHIYTFQSGLQEYTRLQRDRPMEGKHDRIE